MPPFLISDFYFIILGFAKTVFWGKTNHWENILCIDETKLDIFGSLCPVTKLCKANKAFQIKIIIPTVKCGGAVTDGTLNSALYHKILEDNVQPSENDSTKKTVSNLLHSNMNDSFVLIVAKT